MKCEKCQQEGKFASRCKPCLNLGWVVNELPKDNNVRLIALFVYFLAIDHKGLEWYVLKRDKILKIYYDELIGLLEDDEK